MGYLDPTNTQGNNMRAFIGLCLIGVSFGMPSKLGRQARQGYLAPQAEYGVAAPVAQASQVVTSARAAPVARAKPIAITRSSFDGPLPTFRYSYETENDIQQSAEGELRLVDDSEVMVVRGSYSYPGTDGLTYVVDWYADETGFHPSAPHLPEPAVEAQLRFAAEERAAAASNTITRVVEPLAGY